MPINSFHPDYVRWSSEWMKCRDSYEGQRAIKARGTTYLPRLTGQTATEYDAYKRRALFYSITAKAVQAMVGMVISKTPTLRYPTAMASYFEDLSGVQFYELLVGALSENLLMGRIGVLVDRLVTNGPPLPHMYTAESILNWRINFDGTPLMVVLRENVQSSDPSDEFTFLNQYQYRVLRLQTRQEAAFLDPFPSMMDNPGSPSYVYAPNVVNESTEGLVYTVTTYDVNLQLIKKVVPTNTGKPLGYIPFYVANPFGIGFGTVKPPVLDMVDVNLSHYMTSADLEHGRHFTGLPTPIVIGVEASTSLKVGSTSAWVLPDKDANAKYLEFSGQGLQSLEKAMKEKEEQLASMTARMMSASQNGSEAPETVRLRFTSETASLTTIVRSTEALMNVVYKVAASMDEYDTNEVSIVLDKELLDTRMDAASLLKMTQSYIDGGLSTETYVFNLRRGDRIAMTRTDEEEIAALNAKKAELLAANATKGGPAGNAKQ